MLRDRNPTPTVPTTAALLGTMVATAIDAADGNVLSIGASVRSVTIVVGKNKCRSIMPYSNQQSVFLDSYVAYAAQLNLFQRSLQVSNGYVTGAWSVSQEATISVFMGTTLVAQVRDLTCFLS